MARKWWQDLLIGIGASTITVVGVLGSAATGYWNKDRELDIQMVNVSLSILRADTKGTEGEIPRRFALRTLEKYSGVDIPDARRPLSYHSCRIRGMGQWRDFALSTNRRLGAVSRLRL